MFSYSSSVSNMKAIQYIITKSIWCGLLIYKNAINKSITSPCLTVSCHFCHQQSFKVLKLYTINSHGYRLPNDDKLYIKSNKQSYVITLTRSHPSLKKKQSIGFLIPRLYYLKCISSLVRRLNDRWMNTDYAFFL